MNDAGFRLLATRIEINMILCDGAASNWLKAALRGAIDRDPVDAATDADVLHDVLARHADAIIDHARRSG